MVVVRLTFRANTATILSEMTVAKIQEQVGQLPDAERRKLAAWMLATYPPRTVEELVANAQKEAAQGKWVPTPPTADNIPNGQSLQQGLNRFKRLGISL